MSKFLKVLGKIGLVAGKTAINVATKSNPIVGAVVDTVLASVVNAEQSIPGQKKGVEKKALALSETTRITPLLIGVAEAVTGKDFIADHELFAEALSDLTEGVAKLLNSMNRLQGPVVEQNESS